MTALVSLLALLAGCRAAPQGAVDPALASCVPPNARVLGGIHVDQVRANPVLEKLFAGSMALLTPLQSASSVLVMFTGADLLWVARGRFPAAPPGSRLLGPELALTGSDALVRMAVAQHATGRTGAPALVAQAESVASQPIWAVAIGNTPFPFSGNAANLNRLLALTDYTTLTLDAGSQIGLHAAAICGSDTRARQFEETLRALLSLGRAAARDPGLQSVLSAIQVRRDHLTVRVDASGSPELVERLLRAAVRQ